MEPQTLVAAFRSAYDRGHMCAPGVELPADLIAPAVRAAAEPCSFAASHVLARQGDVPDFMYCVLQGEVRLVRTGRGGELVVLQRVRRGWVAEASLFAQHYHCELATGPASTCVRVPIPVLREAFGRSPEFARHWVQGLSVEVRHLRGLSERLRIRSAEQRVIHAIESEGTDGMLRLHGTIKDWAAELGLTHEALYRTLNRMEAAGKLRRQGDALELLASANRGGASAVSK